MSTDSIPAISAQQARFTDRSRSALQTYRELVVGDDDWFGFVYYELCQLFISHLPGVIGFGLRSKLYRRMFAACGDRPAFGHGVLIRNPSAMKIGDRVLVDDQAVLDARRGAAITLGDLVSIGRGTIVAAKQGEISIGDGANIGSYCRLATQSGLKLGPSSLLAAYCYIGPGNHQSGASGEARISQGMEIKGGVEIGANVWIGTRATVLDGVRIGDGAIVGAHSLVLEDVAAGTVVAGTPAKVIRESSSI